MEKTPTRTEQITQSTEFFFEKGREALNKWLNNYPLTEEKITQLQELIKEYKSFSALTVDDELYSLISSCN